MTYQPINERVLRAAHVLLSLFFEGYLQTHVLGREHLPPRGRPTIVVANHTSALDVFAAGFALRRPAHFLAKVEATEIPLFGRFLRSVGAIPAMRDGSDTEALRAMLRVLRDGGTIGLAPEGTRSRDGVLGAYDPGFIWLAVRTDALIVPVAIHGAYALMPRDARWPRRGELWVQFGASMAVAEEGRRPSRERMAERAAEVRRRTLALLVACSVRSGRSDPAVEAARAAGELPPADHSDAATSSVVAQVETR